MRSVKACCPVISGRVRFVNLTSCALIICTIRSVATSIVSTDNDNNSDAIFSVVESPRVARAAIADSAVSAIFKDAESLDCLSIEAANVTHGACYVQNGILRNNLYVRVAFLFV